MCTGYPLYWLYRYVQTQRVLFFSCIGQKKDIDFGHGTNYVLATLVSNRLWFLHSCPELGIFFTRS